VFRTKVVFSDLNFDFLDERLFSEQLRELRGEYDTLLGGEDAMHPIENAAAMRALYPDKDLGITNEDWAGMRAALRRYKTTDRWTCGISNVAAAMTILAADDVRITEHGLEIDRHKELEEDKTPQQPETLAV
jgi:hypothetical protein